MKTIALSDYFYYDEKSPCLLRNKVHRGKARKGEAPGASINNDGYLQTRFFGKLLLTHRIIYELCNGEIGEGMEVDHVNHDRTDNRIENLRAATRSQNTFNCRRRNLKGLPKGINERSPGYYMARIGINGKQLTKSSRDIPSLVEWMDKKRADLHGEYSCF